MATLPVVFHALASNRLSEFPELSHAWSDSPASDRRELIIPAASADGFAVIVQCETYGLYVFADAWHGAPFECGPSTGTLEATAESCLGFVRTLLCADSHLRVFSAARSPYRWRLTYQTEEGSKTEETGSLFFNYFGTRSERLLQNRVLPARYVS